MSWKEKFYTFAALWLALSAIFFIAEYITQWLEVADLGVLAAASLLEGFFAVLGAKLMCVIVSKDFLSLPVRRLAQQRAELVKAVIVVAAVTWEGALTVCRILPGCTLHQHAAHLIFLLLIYPGLGIILKLIIRQRSLQDEC